MWSTRQTDLLTFELGIDAGNVSVRPCEILVNGRVAEGIREVVEETVKPPCCQYPRNPSWLVRDGFVLSLFVVTRDCGWTVERDGFGVDDQASTLAYADKRHRLGGS